MGWKVQDCLKVKSDGKFSLMESKSDGKFYGKCGSQQISTKYNSFNYLPFRTQVAYSGHSRANVHNC